MARLCRGCREKSEIRRVVHRRELRIEVPRREDAEPAKRRSVSTTERSEIRRVVRRRELRNEVPRREDAKPAIQQSVSTAESTTGQMGYPVIPYCPVWVPMWRFSYYYGVWVIVWYTDYV